MKHWFGFYRALVINSSFLFSFYFNSVTNFLFLSCLSFCCAPLGGSFFCPTSLLLTKKKDTRLRITKLDLSKTRPSSGRTQFGNQKGEEKRVLGSERRSCDEGGRSLCRRHWQRNECGERNCVLVEAIDKVSRRESRQSACHRATGRCGAPCYAVTLCLGCARYALRFVDEGAFPVAAAL